MTEKRCSLCEEKHYAKNKCKRHYFAAYSADHHRAHPEARRIASKRWRARNPEYVAQAKSAWSKANKAKVKASRARSSAKHRTKINERARQRYWLNRTACLAQSAAYRAAHRDESIATSAAWRKANPERERQNQAANYRKNRSERLAKQAAWAKAHPDKVLVITMAKRARKRGAPGKHTAEEVLRLYERQKRRCAVCQVSIADGYHRDHIVALSRGGSNDILNIQLLCKACNLGKHAKDPVKFMQERGFLL
jgi:5-methylcytosine-specific restriction endonuclease McrA